MAEENQNWCEKILKNCQSCFIMVLQKKFLNKNVLNPILKLSGRSVDKRRRRFDDDPDCMIWVLFAPWQGRSQDFGLGGPKPQITQVKNKKRSSQSDLEFFIGEDPKFSWRSI